jgi:arabinofuranosyltransferase
LTAAARFAVNARMPRTLALALASYALLAWRFWFTCEDAFISFRYAKHLARGDGLIFNPGESPPVEGYSNLLWVLYLTPFEALGANLPLFANLSSAMCGALLVVLVHRFATRHLDDDARAAGAAAVFLGTLPPVAVWATGGLETMPFALAVFGAFHALTASPERPRWLPAALAASAAVLLRADGFVWVGGVLLATVAFRPADRDLWRAARAVVAVVALVMAANFVWRFAYYGEWLPNTARVKVGFSLQQLRRGWNYLASMLFAFPALALVVAAGGLVRGSRRRTLGLQSATFVAFTGAYTAFLGGDFMAMGRFLVPALPFAAVLLAATLAGWRPRSQLGFAAAVVALNLLAVFDVLPVPRGWRQHLHFRWNLAEAKSEVQQWSFMKASAEVSVTLGRALALETQPGESIVRGTIGAPGYYTELVILDVYGLVSPEVAERTEPLRLASPGHDYGVSYTFFFDRRPTYLAAKLVPIGSKAFLGHSELAMVREGRLEVVREPLPEGQGFPEQAELQLLRLHWDP